MKNIRKIVAFTLAETLIVMGIIGVVAALTIPNLNSSTADKEKVAKVKKVYSNLSDAMGRAEAVYGPVDEWIKDDANATAQATRIGERLTEFMKTTKNCGVSTSGATNSCWSNGYSYSLNGRKTSTWVDSNANYYKVTLADGTGLTITPAINNTTGRVFWAYINIDGVNKRATLGKSVFRFGGFAQNGVQPDSTDSSTINACFGGGGEPCSGWVVQFDNMDYLKVGTDKKCPNGKTILDGTTNTTCK